jgi:hypothetical protein
MRTFAKAAGLDGILVFATVTAELKAAGVDEGLSESEAIVTKLNADVSAITYWVSEPVGWRVVTTVDTVTAQDSAAEKHAVVRFSSVLLPGRSQLISVPCRWRATAGSAHLSPQ